jgi:signal transduction histidine kinase
MATMHSAMKLRLLGFVLAIALLAGLIVWAVLTSSRRVEESRTQVTLAQSESSRIASYLQKSILDLNDRLLKFAIHHDSNDWARFESDWVALNTWIDQQHLTAPAEEQVLAEINAAYDDYHEAAATIERTVRSSVGTTVPAGEFARFQDQAARLLSLSFKLAETHRQTLVSSLAGSSASLAHLRTILFGALFVLLAFGVWLAVVVYHHLIAPLKVRLVESQALLERQEKLAALGVLAAGVAHEIRNPLTAIKAWLFMHQKKLQPGTQEQADADIVANELNRLERIVKDFLLFARPSEPELQVVSANQPLQEVRELLARQLERSNIQLVLENGSPAWIKVDPQQLKQVLINLVQNAADAIGENGSVTLRVKLDHKRLGERDTDVVILEVADTGKGIPAEIAKRLFDPFFSTKESGTGLGLSIAARIIEKHGGVLQYKTQVNHGTTFGIVLRRIENHEDQNSTH